MWVIRSGILEALFAAETGLHFLALRRSKGRAVGNFQLFSADLNGIISLCEPNIVLKWRDIWNYEVMLRLAIMLAHILHYDLIRFIR